MNKSIVFLALISMSVFTSFSQSEQVLPVRIPVVQNYYHGCGSAEQIMAPRGCSYGLVKVVEKSDEVLDITDPELSGLTASPNPTRGMLNVSVPGNLIGGTLQVIDMTGRAVGNPVLVTNTIENLTIEGESGVYLITIRTETELISERVILNTH